MPLIEDVFELIRALQMVFSVLFAVKVLADPDGS
jgi:hypothetical protein